MYPNVDHDLPIVVSLSFAHPFVYSTDREVLSIAERDLVAALSDVDEPPDELAVVSTCLRHELIATGTDELGLRRLVETMSGVVDLPAGEFRYGCDAVRHLFRVTAGLCSPVVGEAEVLGQVRRSHSAAQKAETIGPVLDRIFREAIRTARSARRCIPDPDTGSIAAICVDHLLERPSGTLVLVGAGETANAVFDGLNGSDWEITRIARRPDRVGGDALGLDSLEPVLSRTDVLVTAVTSTTPIVDATMLKRVSVVRDELLSIIDLGMPANVARPDGGTSTISYDGIDDLADDDSHRRSTSEAEALIDVKAAEAHARVVNTSLSGLIRALRHKAEDAQREEVDRAIGRLSAPTEADRAVLTQMARTLANRLLHDPLLYLSSHPEAVATSRTARTLLGINDD